MTSETKLVFELWDSLRENITASKRLDSALQILRLFEEYGMEVDRRELEGECEYLDDALQALADFEEEDVDNDWDEEED